MSLSEFDQAACFRQICFQTSTSRLLLKPGSSETPPLLMPDKVGRSGPKSARIWFGSSSIGCGLNPTTLSQLRHHFGQSWPTLLGPCRPNSTKVGALWTDFGLRSVGFSQKLQTSGKLGPIRPEFGGVPQLAGQCAEILLLRDSPRPHLLAIPLAPSRSAGRRPEKRAGSGPESSGPKKQRRRRSF